MEGRKWVWAKANVKQLALAFFLATSLSGFVCRLRTLRLLLNRVVYATSRAGDVAAKKFVKLSFWFRILHLKKIV